MTAMQLATHLQDANPLLIDVREPWEFDICHIEGSLNIPMGQIAQQLDKIETADEAVIICHHGIRSAQVIHYLQQQSIDQLINLDGGVDAWAREVDSGLAIY